MEQSGLSASHSVVCIFGIARIHPRFYPKKTTSKRSAPATRQASPARPPARPALPPGIWSWCPTRARHVRSAPASCYHQHTPSPSSLAHHSAGSQSTATRGCGAKWLSNQCHNNRASTASPPYCTSAQMAQSQVLASARSGLPVRPPNGAADDCFIFD